MLEMGQAEREAAAAFYPAGGQDGRARRVLEHEDADGRIKVA
jgi:hypothetical protein